MPSRSSHGLAGSASFPGIVREVEDAAMRVLVTGAAGFVASHIVDALVGRGDAVVAVDNLASGERPQVHPGASFFECDVRSDEFAGLVEAERPEAIVHHAAQPQVGPSVRDPFHDLDVNARGLLVLLTAASRAGVRQVVYASSGGTVYGSTERLPIREDAPTLPENPYAITKLAGEHYVRYFAKAGGFAGTALRYANIYGPRDHVSSEHVITVFAERMLTGRPCVIQWDGEQAKDYVYVADVVRANLRALDLGRGGTFNIGSGHATSVNQIYRALEAIIGPQPAPSSAPKRSGDVRAFYLDCGRAKEELRWEATVPLEDGLRETVAWYREAIKRGPLA